MSRYLAVWRYEFDGRERKCYAKEYDAKDFPDAVQTLVKDQGFHFAFKPEECEIFRVLVSDSSYFDEWSKATQEDGEAAEEERQRRIDEAEFERLRKKLGK
jgi:hypothetical protein